MNARTRTRLILPLLALTVWGAYRTAHAEADVFDKPSLQTRHLQLMAAMSSSHARKAYDDMETVCREGLDLGSSDELWSYNLACACALQGKTDAALTALDQAIDAGFLDTEHLAKDPDLDALRETDGFEARLSRMQRLEQTSGDAPARLVFLAPDDTQTVSQCASNTLWSFQMGIFHCFVELPRTNPPAPYRGPEADRINAWIREGNAAGAAGVLYVNRDNDTKPLDVTRYPGMTRLAYVHQMAERSLNIGLPNTLFARDNEGNLAPVIGHSSMGYLNSPYWRSQPRAVCGDPRQPALQTVFLMGNQLFFYPVYGDYDLRSGDLFPANIPACFAVAGQLNAEQPFVEAAAAGLAAMRPETRAALSREGLLMPALNMLFRASQRTLSSPHDYLTGLAHPPAFQPGNLDTAKLVKMAHALTTNDLPPVVVLAVRRETRMIPGRDFFDLAGTEHLFDSPMAIGRVFRGAARTRTYDLQAFCKRPDARLHWVLLQGDPEKVTFTPNPTNNALMTVSVAHHTPFQTPIGNGQRIHSSRVDVGVIAETPGTFSMPAILSVCFLGNEQRVYDDDGRILSIDYTRAQPGYTDPLLSYTRNWKDVYAYDAKGTRTGWTRIRGGVRESFTAYGHLVAGRDALGRPLLAHVVRYLPRRIRETDANEGFPDIAQVDDNVTVTYRYASDDDRVGVPDMKSITQAIQPPDSDDAP